MYVMSTYIKFVCPYCLQTSHKVSQSIGLFGAQAPLGRFLHSGDSPVFGRAFNWTEVRSQRWILDGSDERQFLFCHLLHSHCIWLLREWLANLEKIITKEFLFLLFLWLFFGRLLFGRVPPLWSCSCYRTRTWPRSRRGWTQNCPAIVLLTCQIIFYLFLIRL